MDSWIRSISLRKSEALDLDLSKFLLRRDGDVSQGLLVRLSAWGEGTVVWLAAGDNGVEPEVFPGFAPQCKRFDDTSATRIAA